MLKFIECSWLKLGIQVEAHSNPSFQKQDDGTAKKYKQTEN